MPTLKTERRGDNLRFIGCSEAPCSHGVRNGTHFIREWDLDADVTAADAKREFMLIWRNQMRVTPVVPTEETVSQAALDGVL